MSEPRLFLCEILGQSSGMFPKPPVASICKCVARERSTKRKKKKIIYLVIDITSIEQHSQALCRLELLGWLVVVLTNEFDVLPGRDEVQRYHVYVARHNVVVQHA